MTNSMNGIMGMLQQFKTNPMQFLLQQRLNIPQGLNMNDPNAILNHLLSTGQINQQQINQAYQRLQQFR